MSPRPKPFNEYRVEGDVAYLLLRPSRGPQKGEVVGEAIIDAADLPALIENGRPWYLHSEGYVSHTLKIDGKSVAVLLHRHLMNPGPGMVVDHLNRNPLDNRRANLRVCTHSDNQTNRDTHRNNKLGVKNVRFVACKNSRRPYCVTIRKHHHRLFEGYCRTLNIARITASLARLQYQGREYAA